jgi:large subunit ribosomal protein L36
MGGYVLQGSTGVKPHGEEAVMKKRSSIRSLKKQPGSVVVKRHGKVFVINRANPRMKTRQG